MLGAMIKRSDIHTFEDEAFLRGMTRLSAVAFAGGLAATIVLAVVLTVAAPELFDRWLIGTFAPEGDGFFDYLRWFGWIAVATVVALAAHELVHGALFKLFAPAGSRVYFGANWKRGMLYACADGIVYTRRQYLMIALAPSFVVTTALVAAGFACACPTAGAFAAALHLSGCAGDWCYAAEIIRDPAIAYCMDTDWGVCFYAEDEPDGEVTQLGTGAFWDIQCGRRMSQNAPVPNRDTPDTVGEGDAE